MKLGVDKVAQKPTVVYIKFVDEKAACTLTTCPSENHADKSTRPPTDFAQIWLMCSPQETYNLDQTIYPDINF